MGYGVGEREEVRGWREIEGFKGRGGIEVRREGGERGERVERERVESGGERGRGGKREWREGGEREWEERWWRERVVRDWEKEGKEKVGE